MGRTSGKAAEFFRDAQGRLVVGAAPEPLPTFDSEVDQLMLSALSTWDEIVPAQMLYVRENPIRTLQLACLWDAYRVLSGTAPLVNNEQFVYDVWWVEGRRKSAPGFSLDDICTSLGIATADVRERFLSLARDAKATGQRAPALPFKRLGRAKPIAEVA